jgi:hypothetical protein
LKSLSNKVTTTTTSVISANEDIIKTLNKIEMFLTQCTTTYSFFPHKKYNDTWTNSSNWSIIEYCYFWKYCIDNKKYNYLYKVQPLINFHFRDHVSNLDSDTMLETSEYDTSCGNIYSNLLKIEVDSYKRSYLCFMDTVLPCIYTRYITLPTYCEQLLYQQIFDQLFTQWIKSNSIELYNSPEFNNTLIFDFNITTSSGELINELLKLYNIVVICDNDTDCVVDDGLDLDIAYNLVKSSNIDISAFLQDILLNINFQFLKTITNTLYDPELTFNTWATFFENSNLLDSSTKVAPFIQNTKYELILFKLFNDNILATSDSPFKSLIFEQFSIFETKSVELMRDYNSDIDLNLLHKRLYSIFVTLSADIIFITPQIISTFLANIENKITVLNFTIHAVANLVFVDMTLDFHDYITTFNSFQSTSLLYIKNTILVYFYNWLKKITSPTIFKATTKSSTTLYWQFNPDTTITTKTFIDFYSNKLFKWNYDVVLNAAAVTDITTNYINTPTVTLENLKYSILEHVKIIKFLLADTLLVYSSTNNKLTLTDMFTNYGYINNNVDYPVVDLYDNVADGVTGAFGLLASLQVIKITALDTTGENFDFIFADGTTHPTGVVNIYLKFTRTTLLPIYDSTYVYCNTSTTTGVDAFLTLRPYGKLYNSGPRAVAVPIINNNNANLELNMLSHPIDYFIGTAGALSKHNIDEVTYLNGIPLNLNDHSTNANIATASVREVHFINRTEVTHTGLGTNDNESLIYANYSSFANTPSLENLIFGLTSKVILLPIQTVGDYFSYTTWLLKVKHSFKTILSQRLKDTKFYNTSIVNDNMINNYHSMYKTIYNSIGKKIGLTSQKIMNNLDKFNNTNRLKLNYSVLRQNSGLATPTAPKRDTVTDIHFSFNNDKTSDFIMDYYNIPYLVNEPFDIPQSYITEMLVEPFGTSNGCNNIHSLYSNKTRKIPNIDVYLDDVILLIKNHFDYFNNNIKVTNLLGFTIPQSTRLKSKYIIKKELNFLVHDLVQNKYNFILDSDINIIITDPQQTNILYFIDGNSINLETFGLLSSIFNSNNVLDTYNSSDTKFVKIFNVYPSLDGIIRTNETFIHENPYYTKKIYSGSLVNEFITIADSIKLDFKVDDTIIIHNKCYTIKAYDYIFILDPNDNTKFIHVPSPDGGPYVIELNESTTITQNPISFTKIVYGEINYYLGQYKIIPTHKLPDTFDTNGATVTGNTQDEIFNCNINENSIRFGYDIEFKFDISISHKITFSRVPITTLVNGNDISKNMIYSTDIILEFDGQDYYITDAGREDYGQFIRTYNINPATSTNDIFIYIDKYPVFIDMTQIKTDQNNVKLKIEFPHGNNRIEGVTPLHVSNLFTDNFGENTNSTLNRFNYSGARQLTRVISKTQKIVYWVSLGRETTDWQKLYIWFLGFSLGDTTTTSFTTKQLDFDISNTSEILLLDNTIPIKILSKRDATDVDPQFPDVNIHTEQFYISIEEYNLYQEIILPSIQQTKTLTMYKEIEIIITSFSYNTTTKLFEYIITALPTLYNNEPLFLNNITNPVSVRIDTGPTVINLTSKTFLEITNDKLYQEYTSNIKSLEPIIELDTSGNKIKNIDYRWTDTLFDDIILNNKKFEKLYIQLYFDKIELVDDRVTSNQYGYRITNINLSTNGKYCIGTINNESVNVILDIQVDVFAINFGTIYVPTKVPSNLLTNLWIIQYNEILYDTSVTINDAHNIYYRYFKKYAYLNRLLASLKCTIDLKKWTELATLMYKQLVLSENTTLVTNINNAFIKLDNYILIEDWILLEPIVTQINNDINIFNDYIDVNTILEEIKSYLHVFSDEVDPTIKLNEILVSLIPTLTLTNTTWLFHKKCLMKDTEITNVDTDTILVNTLTKIDNYTYKRKYYPTDLYGIDTITKELYVKILIEDYDTGSLPLTTDKSISWKYIYDTINNVEDIVKLSQCELVDCTNPTTTLCKLLNYILINIPVILFVYGQDYIINYYQFIPKDIDECDELIQHPPNLDLLFKDPSINYNHVTANYIFNISRSSQLLNIFTLENIKVKKNEFQINLENMKFYNSITFTNVVNTPFTYTDITIGTTNNKILRTTNLNQIILKYLVSTVDFDHVVNTYDDVVFKSSVTVTTFEKLYHDFILKFGKDFVLEPTIRSIEYERDVITVVADLFVFTNTLTNGIPLHHTQLTFVDGVTTTDFVVELFDNSNPIITKDLSNINYIPYDIDFNKTIYVDTTDVLTLDYIIDNRYNEQYNVIYNKQLGLDTLVADLPLNKNLNTDIQIYQTKTHVVSTTNILGYFYKFTTTTNIIDTDIELNFWSFKWGDIELSVVNDTILLDTTQFGIVGNTTFILLAQSKLNLTQQFAISRYVNYNVISYEILPNDIDNNQVFRLFLNDVLPENTVIGTYALDNYFIKTATRESDHQGIFVIDGNFNIKILTKLVFSSNKPITTVIPLTDLISNGGTEPNTLIQITLTSDILLDFIFLLNDIWNKFFKITTNNVNIDFILFNIQDSITFGIIVRFIDITNIDLTSIPTITYIINGSYQIHINTIDTSSFVNYIVYDVKLPKTVFKYIEDNTIIVVNTLSTIQYQIIDERYLLIIDNNTLTGNITVVSNTTYSINLFQYDEELLTLSWTPPDNFEFFNLNSASEIDEYYINTTLLTVTTVNIETILFTLPNELILTNDTLIEHRHTFINKPIIHYVEDRLMKFTFYQDLDFTNALFNQKQFALLTFDSVGTEVGSYIYKLTSSPTANIFDTQFLSKQLILITTTNIRYDVYAFKMGITNPTDSVYISTWTPLPEDVLNTPNNHSLYLNDTLIATLFDIDYITKKPFNIEYYKSDNFKEHHFIINENHIDLLLSGDLTNNNTMFNQIIPNIEITNIYNETVKNKITVIGSDVNTQTTTTLVPSKIRYKQYPAHRFIRKMEFLFGDQIVDTITGEWLDVYYNYFVSDTKKRGYNKMIGVNDELQTYSTTINKQSFYLPLPFWFVKHKFMSIPVVSIQYTPPKIKIYFNQINEIIENDIDISLIPQTTVKPELLVNYYYLGQEEREQFIRSRHEYLIETHQFQKEIEIKELHKIINLNFKHPTKDVFWRYNINGKRQLETKTTDNDDVYLNYVANKEKYDGLKAINVTINDVAFNFKTTFSIFEEITSDLVAYELELITYIANGGSIWNYTMLFARTFSLNKNAIKETNKSTINLTLLLYLWKKLLKYIGDENIAGTLTDSQRIISLKLDRIREYVFNKHQNNELITTSSPLVDAHIRLNGKQLFTTRDNNYFNYNTSQRYKITPEDGYYNYSFALHPLEYQPSGTCNFSVVKDSTLNITSKQEVIDNNGTVTLFGRKYMLLRIMSGIAGIAYHN